MDRNVVGLRITRRLENVEAKLDDLLAEASDLMAEVARAKSVLGESTIGSQRPIARLASLQQHLVDGRSDIGRAHADMAKIAANQRDIPTGCPTAGCAEPVRNVA
jgi:multidrug resistance efflux pump